MLKNYWDEKKNFYCTNHEEPVLMYVFEGSKSPFFACPKYMLKDAEHPDGHEPEENACANRFSFNIAIGIINYIMQACEQDLSGLGRRSLTGWRFKYKNVDVRILECDRTGNITKIGVKNNAEIQSWVKL